MKIDEKDLIEFIEDHIVTKPTGKIIRILPFEWDDFLKEQREKANDTRRKS